MERISRDDLFLAIAELVAQRGTCPRAQVGAVIVRSNRIISIGYNGAPSGFAHCDRYGCFERHCQTCGKDRPNPECVVCSKRGCERSSHAEANAIAFAARDGISVIGGSLYVTHEVCADCARLLVNCGIQQVFYRNPYTRNSGQTILNHGGVKVTRL